MPQDDIIDVYALLFVTIVIETTSALALGLLASAAVSTPRRPALALPMLCRSRLGCCRPHAGHGVGAGPAVQARCIPAMTPQAPLR